MQIMQPLWKQASTGLTDCPLVFDPSLLNEQKLRLINQIWKLIPMCENKEDWRVHLDTIVEELAGLSEVLNLVTKVDFLILLAKLVGLYDIGDSNFMLFRKTVFKCIDLLVKVMQDE